MAIYNILKEGDPALREKSKAVPKVTPNILKLIENMLDTMYDADGVGLAAPQIGVLKRVAVVDIGEGPIALINPRVIQGQGQLTDTEGCLSCPGVIGEVARFKNVQVEALNQQGEKIVIEAENLFAVALQHEIDHLDGILFIDKATNLRQLE